MGDGASGGHIVGDLMDGFGAGGIVAGGVAAVEAAASASVAAPITTASATVTVAAASAAITTASAAGAGGTARLRVGRVEGLVQAARGQVDAALAVHLGNADAQFVAEFDHVLGLADALIGVGELGNVDQAVLAGDDLDERAELEEPDDGALVDLAGLDRLGHILDDLAGQLAAPHRPRRRC